MKEKMKNMILLRLRIPEHSKEKQMVNSNQNYEGKD